MTVIDAIVRYNNTFTAALPLLATVVVFVRKKKVPAEFWWITAACTCSLVTDAGLHFYRPAVPIKRLWVNVYGLCEVLLMTGLYFHLLKGKWKQLLAGIGAALLVYEVVMVFIAYQETRYLSSVFESALVGLYSIGFYFFLIEEEIEVPLLDNYKFWMNTGVFIYFCGALSLLFLEHYKNRGVWPMHNLLNTFMFVFLFVGILTWDKKHLNH